jgi:hypothetical protein
MQKIPEAEARRILAQPLRCEDWMDWMPVRVQAGTAFTAAGVLDAHGLGTKLLVELHFRRDLKTKLVTYMATVFLRNAYGRERVYQLTVTQSPKTLKDAHRRSHEHIGDLRVEGSAEWNEWGYDEVLAYFCKQTGIAFDPQPPHPELFQLKG